MRALPELIVPYRAGDGTYGLTYDDGQVHAWLSGKIVASAEAEASNIGEVLSDYRVLGLFPTLGFAYDQPRRYRAEIQIVPGLSDEVTFRMRVFGEDVLDDDMLAYAQFITDPIFERVDEVPSGQVCHEASREGWLIHLPGPLLSHPDAVVRKRCAQAVEHYLHAIAIGREVLTPYVWHFSNVMDAAHPMWQLNLPRIALTSER